MKKIWVAIAGIALLVFGAVSTFLTSRRYTEQHVVANAGNCQMEVSLVQRAGLAQGSDAGAVVLFHGIAANRVIMLYLARAFAEQGLRVFVPDLPGHGRSPGPFSPEQAETCGLSFVRGLAGRGYIQPARTILAGHSMGGAIALRVAAKFRPAGVVAISPAPMVTAHGVSTELLLFHNPPPVPPNSLIIVGQFEPEWLRENARDYSTASQEGTAEFAQVPLGTHVSVLFAPTVARLAQEWTAKVLQLNGNVRLPSRVGFLGALWGVVGILLIAGPFIRETIGEHPEESSGGAKKLPALRLAAEFAVVSVAVIAVLRYWMPLRPIHVFQGDFLASFFLLVGLTVVLLHARLAQRQFRTKPLSLLAAAFAGFVLFLLLTGWLQLTLTGSWLTLERWTRFPLFFLATFLFLYGIELALGPVVAGRTRQRLLLGLGLVCLMWLALAGGVALLHNGEILLVLLSFYFALIFLFVGLGAQLVRRTSGSATAAAIFGAILLAGFCLVLFPVS